MKYLLTTLITFLSPFLLAQNATRIYYLDTEVATSIPDSARFYLDLTIQGDTLYQYTEYDKSGVRRAEGFAVRIMPMLERHDRYTTFYPHQQKHREGRYFKNQPMGIWRTYHPNGKLEEMGVWAKNPRPYEAPLRYLLTTYADSTGQMLVTQGHGTITRHDPKGSVQEVGSYREGLKDSVWVGYRTDGRKEYEETYTAGVLQEGRSFDAQANTYPYTTLDTPISFESDGLFKFLNLNIRYPPEAQRAESQGTVILNFLIDTQGVPQDIRVSSSPDPILTKEAIRVIQLSKGKWKPATKRGKVVANRFVLPIPFKII
ncbi:energy transducer TonB [Siphonobacter curvatus]|uniref:TonB C-terminal domain-containing protein n=1 Tax=Siphonobacter curvatus TaxID=2094562 RepID=A0A2S7ISI4_9BACT|nr:energy transducer TonB [Siphonobacter curvatus]PQA60665.1 hypothetical protein C5O19_13930 [Siphonobacter curvatus]